MRFVSPLIYQQFESDDASATLNSNTIAERCVRKQKTARASCEPLLGDGDAIITFES